MCGEPRRWDFRACADVVPFGTREVEDDLPGFAVNFLLGGGEGAEEEVANVSHDGRAVRSWAPKRRRRERKSLMGTADLNSERPAKSSAASSADLSCFRRRR